MKPYGKNTWLQEAGNGCLTNENRMADGMAAMYQIGGKFELRQGKYLTAVYESTYNPRASLNRSP